MIDKEKNANAFDTTDTSKFSFEINGIPFESDEPIIIMGPVLKAESEMKELWVKISDEVKSYERMCYTTDVETVNLIFSNMTIRGSSLSNVKLNDSKEKERVGVSQFAGGRYITCFSHIEHESVPFWVNYGGNKKTKKVLLKFMNFSSCFDKCINTDYCLIADDKKMFFYSDEYKKTLNNNCTIGQMIGLPQINTDFDIRNCLRSIEVFDVGYIPTNSEVFSKDFSSTRDIDISKFSSNSGQTVLKDIKTFNPDCLGKQKSDPWDYERESRIMCCLDHQEFSMWSYIDLRLKQEMFRNLVIVLSPWADEDLQIHLEKIIEKSMLSDEIKKSISIEHSVLEGTLNI